MQILALIAFVSAAAMPMLGFQLISSCFRRRYGFWCAGMMSVLIALNTARGAFVFQAYLADYAWDDASHEPVFTWLQDSLVALLTLVVWFCVLWNRDSVDRRQES